MQESGRRGEPLLAGNGFARIGEGSGSTNVLTGSGVDEAWTTGSQLAEAVLELLRAAKPFDRENLERTYLARRRASWVEQEGRVAEKARDGFHRGMVTGLIGMALAGFTNGKHSLAGEPKLLPQLADYYRGKIPAAELDRIVAGCRSRSLSCHDALMERCGWPAIPYDGQLLVTHQDAFANAAQTRCASRCARGRPLRPVRTASRYSTAKSACIAAPVYGTAGPLCRTIRSVATSPFRRAPAGCIRRRIRGAMPVGRTSDSDPEAQATGDVPAVPAFCG